MKSPRYFVAALLFAVFSVFSLPASAQSLGDTTENGIISAIKGTSYAYPATVSMGLSTAACSDSSVGTEVTGGSYARVAMTSASSWTGPSAGNGIITNTNVLTFPAPSANWGTVTHWFIADASTAGNVLVCAALTTPRSITSGAGAPSFAAGAVAITIQ